MKKLLVCLSAAVALNAFAAWQKVATLQVADVNSLVQGVNKLGELTGNMMLGTMASTALTELPGSGLFGPGRDKTPMTFCLFLDDVKLEKVLADKAKAGLDSPLSYALLYPVRQGKAEFVKSHEGCKETDGVLRVVEDEEIDEDEDATFVAFSKDGKWASMSDKAAQAKLGLEDVRIAERPMKGDLLKLAVTPKGVSVMCRVIEKCQAELAKQGKGDDVADALLGVDYAMDVLKGMSALIGGLAIDDTGVVMHASVGTVEGSELAKCGLKSLEADPLAFAPKSALAAVASAADCGQRTFDLEALLKVLAKHGIKTDSFLKIEESQPGNKSVLTVDVPAAVAFAKKFDTKTFKLDEKAFQKDLCALFKPSTFTAANPPVSTAIAIKGYASPVSASERLAATLPEAAQKKPFTVQVFSLYSTVKALLPVLLAELDADERAGLEPLVKSLPPEGKGGIAIAGWRAKDKLNTLMRVSADELKLLSAGVSAFSAYQMQAAMKEAKKAQKQKKSQAKKPAAKAE